MTTSRPGVMQVVLSLSPGGTERLVIELVRRLSDRFRMLVCCLDEPGAWAPELTALGVPVLALHRQPGFQPALGLRLARLAAAHDISMLHAHHYSPFVYARIAAVAQRRLGVVFTEHGRLSDAPPSRKRRLANLALARTRAPMFAVSAALREHMIAEGFPGGRLGVIHNGVDPAVDGDRRAARALLGIPPDAFLIGTVARLDAVKDLGTFVAAVARIRRRVPAVRAVIVGDGDERSALAAAIHDSGCEGVISLIGFRSDARALLPALDVFVNCSISEGISLTILEAMAAGVPVVATRVGGTPEIVVDGRTGLLVEARSPGDLGAALERLAGDSVTRVGMGAAGRARVADGFTLERMAADYARVYDEGAR
jgi:L-malate glycosyltransferase